MYDRYIKESDARHAIMDYIGEQTVSKYASSAECKAARYGAEGAMYAIEDVPTADVVEVVRCKDCKHYKRHKPPIEDFDGWCSANEIECDTDFYCQYGSMKGGE